MKHAPSYRKLNYTIRLGKTIERKYFLEVFKKLNFFQSLRDYRYIGFGSTYFADFILYHKVLGFKEMISIEREQLDQTRFNFNKPYSCIDMCYGDANEVLPGLDWNKKTIAWLDYDKQLDSSKLDDISTLVANMQSGSFFLISVAINSIELPKEGDINEYRIEKLKQMVGYERVPIDITGSDLNKKNLPSTYGKIILNEIVSALTSRNGPLEEAKKIQYEQVVNILYNDGTQMLTIGGVFYSGDDQDKFEKANFKELNFYSNNYECFEIIAPNLTIKEIKYLDALLPDKIDKDGNVSEEYKKVELPNDDIMNYAKIYRYYPTFAEAIV